MVSPNWRGFRSINKCGYVYDRDGQNEFLLLNVIQVLVWWGPLIQNGKAVG